MYLMKDGGYRNMQTSKGKTQGSCVMAHNATSVPRMEDPTERLGQIVSRVEDSRYVEHDDISGGFPVLDGKELDVDMA